MTSAVGPGTRSEGLSGSAAMARPDAHVPSHVTSAGTAFCDVLFGKRGTLSLRSVAAEQVRLPRATQPPARAAGAASAPLAPGRPRRGDDDKESPPTRSHRARPLRVADFQPSMPMGAPAQLAWATGASSPGPSTPSARAAASLEDLVPALVRRVAWSGDGRRGTARLEIGAGELAGATLLVHADDGRVSVHLTVPPGASANEWQTRIRNRLAARNITTDSVEVT